MLYLTNIGAAEPAEGADWLGRGGGGGGGGGGRGGEGCEAVWGVTSLGCGDKGGTSEV